MTAACFELLKSHLRSPFLTAFAYGSGVFRQAGSSGHSGKMIDFLVVVNDSEIEGGWHERNMKVNPSDYPFLSRVALKTTNLFSDSVYYVPDVKVRDRRIKYGVVSWDTLLRDLYTWDFMFLAGRLHKPTLMDEAAFETKRTLSAAMERNYDSALNVALLISTEAADFKETLRKIVALSYTNDPRLLLAESPRKIENIVDGQLPELEKIYLERWEEHEGRRWLWDPLMRMKLINDLPCALKTELLSWNESLWRVALSRDPKPITDAIGRMVRRSAWRQMVLGAVSASSSTAIGYVLSKMKKRFDFQQNKGIRL